MANEEQLRGPNLLYVEGKTEELFFTRFLQHIDCRAQIINYKGDGNLKGRLKADAVSPVWKAQGEIRAVAITGDAEWPPDNPQRLSKSTPKPKAYFRSRSESRCSCFKELGLKPPGDVGVAQTSQDSGLRYGAYLLPNNSACGAIEDLWRDSLQNSEASQCVEAWLACAEEADDAVAPIQTARSKAWMVARYLISENYGRKMSFQDQVKLLDLDSEVFADLKDFLVNLFARQE
jgi:hypothetical protein